MTVLLTTLVWVLALTLSVVLGRWVTARLLAHIDAADRKQAHPGTTPADDGATAPVGEHGADGVDSPRVRAVLRGGMWIGVLERIAVTGCILVGFTAGIAVVVAVKGLGRFPQLRDDPAASERFVIGSLASLVWAAVVGFAALALVDLIP